MTKAADGATEMGMVERVARALFEKEAARFRQSYGWDEIVKYAGTEGRQHYTDAARAAIEAGKYQDADEDACVVAEHRVGLHGALIAEAHDALIDAILAEDQT